METRGPPGAGDAMGSRARGHRRSLPAPSRGRRRPTASPLVRLWRRGYRIKSSTGEDEQPEESPCSSPNPGEILIFNPVFVYPSRFDIKFAGF
jgi:hypothetical protein